MGSARGAITRLQALIGDRSHPLIEALSRLDDTSGGGGGGGGAGGEFVYRQGGVASGSVFTSFAAAYAAAFATGVPATICIDNSLAAPFVTPGAYDCSQITVAAYSITPNSIFMDLQNGVTFTALAGLIGVTLVSKSAAPIFTVSGQTFCFLQDGAAFRTDPAGTGPFVHVLPNAAFAVVLQLGGTLNANDATRPILQVDANGVAFVLAAIAGNVADNALAGAGAGIVQVLSSSASISLTQVMVPPNFQVSLGTNANVIGFDPSGRAPLWNESPWLPWPSPGPGGDPNVDAALTNLLRRVNLFVLAPGQTPGGQKFADLASLCNAANQASPGPRTIVCDFTSVAGTYTVPPGVYAASGNVTMIVPRAWGTGSTTLNLADGAILQGFFDFEDVLVVGNASIAPNAPLLVPPNVTAQYSFSGESGCGLQNNGPAPLLLSQGQSRVVLRGRANVSNAGPIAVLATDATPGSSLDLEAYDLTQVGSNTLSYDPASGGTVYVSDGARVDFVQFVPGGKLLAGPVPSYVIEGSFSGAVIGPGPVYLVKHDLGTLTPIVVLYDNAGVLTAPVTVQVVDENNVNVTTLAPGFVGTVGVRRLPSPHGPPAASPVPRAPVPRRLVRRLERPHRRRDPRGDPHRAAPDRRRLEPRRHPHRQPPVHRPHRPGHRR